ncbi:SCO7613 C-terminal domain-containing membrane protein [Pseudoclavibacter helvolus]|uniref:SCO7613 C-terminal domain-containing membrane protein n=1 Tax=Pseudoclavibacter helvolus TaxID=255205 RepID=UPI003C72CA14
MTDAAAGRQAQRPRFPKTLGDLTDPSKCPSCFEAYGAPGPACVHCGFTRDRAVISHLLELGAQARDPLLARGEFIVAANEEARSRAAAQQLAADHARLLGGAVGQLGADAAPASAESSSNRPAPRPQPQPQPQPQAQPHGGTRTSIPQPAAHIQVPAPTQAPAHPQAPGHGRAPAPHQAPPQRPPSAALPTQPSQPSQPSRPRRSSVQLLLLVLGIGLLSIAAIVFLTFAWVVFGVEVKAAITAGVTLAVIATASILKRRRLSATAEGIAALGIVLVVLDVWAVQATGLLGADRAPGTLYWGLGLAVATVAFEAWHRLSGLRAPGIAASLTALPAVALTVAGATSSVLSPVQRLVLALVLAGAASALHVLLRIRQPQQRSPDSPNAAGSFTTASPRSLERWILSVTGIVALAGGVLAGSAASTGNAPWAGYAFLFVLAAGSSALLAWLVSRERGALGSRSLLVSFGILTALALGAVPLSFTGPLRLALSLALIPISLAAVQVLMTRLAASTQPQAAALRLACTAWTWTTLTAATVPILSLAISAVHIDALFGLFSADQARIAAAFAGAKPGTWWAIASGALGLAGAAGILQLVPGRMRQLTPALAASGSFLALCAAASVSGAFGVTVTNLVLASASVTAAVVLARNAAAASGEGGSPASALRLVSQCVSALAILAIGIAGLALPGLEIAALVAAAALTFLLRFSAKTAASTLRPVLTAFTAAQLLAVPLLVAFVRDAWTSPNALGTNLAVTCAYLGIVVLLTAPLLFPRPWLSAVERTLLAYAAAVPALVASFALLTLLGSFARRTDDGDLLIAAAWPTGALWVVAAAFGALLCAAIVAVAVRRTQDVDAPAVAPLLAVLAPALWATLAAALTAFTDAEHLPAVASSFGVVAAALAAGGALTARLRGAHPARVLPAELAAAAVAAVSLASTSVFSGDFGQPGGAQYVALTVAVAAVVPVLLALSPAGLFQARGRAFLAWVGVALLTIAWYVFAIGTPSITTAEAFHLPAGVPLVVAALLLWWFGRSRRSDVPARASACVLAAGLALSFVAPALASSQAPERTLLYFFVGAGLALGVALTASLLRVPEHARPLLVSVSASAGGVAVLAALAHLAVNLTGDPNRGGFFVALLASAEALIWLTACVLLVGLVAWLLLRPVWSSTEARARRVLLITLLAALAVAVCVGLLLSTRFEAALLLLGLAFLAALPAAALPGRLVSPGGRAALALVGLVALASQSSSIALWSPAAPAFIWVQQQASITALLLGTIAAAAALVARQLPQPSVLTRLVSYTTGALATWMLVHHIQLIDLRHTSPVQLVATAGVIGTLVALLGVLLAPHGTRRADGIALRTLGLGVALIGVVLAPSAASAAPLHGFGTWTPLPLAIALLAATAVVSSAHLGARSPFAWLRYGGVPALALAWVWEVLANWDGASIFVAFGGAFLVFFAAGVATSGRTRASDGAQAPGVESLLWLAAAPGVWLTAGALAAVAQPVDAAGSRILSLSLAELALAMLTLALVVACASVPVPARLRASANALGVGASISAVVLGPALVLAAQGPLTALALPLCGVVPACLVLLFASALWRQQRQLENPRLAALSSTVLVPAAIAALVCSAFPSILRGIVEHTQQIALPWVAVLCALALATLLRPELLPTLAPATSTPGARPPLRLPVLAFSAASLVAVVGVLGARQATPWLELATAPLGATLLAGGLYFLAQRPMLRSWTALTPGLLLLLVPSYLAQFADPAPWRLISLGLLAVGITVWGATRRLQAPLVLGAIITVLHAVTAFRQQLAVVAGVVPWWVWLALAGTVLVIIATTYEARLRDAKRAAASIRSLR